MKITLFTYGTLEFSQVMQMVTGQDFCSAPAVLKDYARFRLVAESYPGVTYDKGAEVAGTVYFEIDETTLHKLDRYEDTCYTRLDVEVHLQDGEVIEAMAYIIEDARKDLLSDTPWDKQKFIEHDLDVFIRSIGSRS